jgi:hypothetical protein
MKNALVLFLAAFLSLAFAVPAPQQITIQLGQSFSIAGLDMATFDDMNFRLESVTMKGDKAQVVLTLTTGESETPEMLMLGLPDTGSIKIGEYALTLLGAGVPADTTMLCAVSRAMFVLEKTEESL